MFAFGASLLLFGIVFAAIAVDLAAAQFEIQAQCSSCTNCATCESKSIVGDSAFISISVAACSTSTISWVCCISSNGTNGAGSCDLTGGCYNYATGQLGIEYCNTVNETLVFEVPSDAYNITVQLHDGTFNGTYDCGGGKDSPSLCCGGSGSSCQGAVSGVCQTVIQLSSCPVAPPPTPSSSLTPPPTSPTPPPVTNPPCTSDQLQNCINQYGSRVCVKDVTCRTSLDPEFGVYVPICTPILYNSTHKCGNSTDLCDNDHFCTGNGLDCPEKNPKINGTWCRDPEGDCDVTDYCDGISIECFNNYKNDTVNPCRAEAGICDVAEYCDGTGPNCPANAFKPQDENDPCRPKAGVCDVAELCPGNGPKCPADAFKPQDENDPCRPEAGVCDVAELCPGNGPYCPGDTVRDDFHVCRPEQDKCDELETCDGFNVTCPADLRRDCAYTYKCGTTQFLCGVTVEELTKGKGNQYYLGSCNIGMMGDYELLLWPQCVGQPVGALCPNGKGLSNFVEAKCVPETGKWNECKKIDVGDTTSLPIYPSCGANPALSLIQGVASKQAALAHVLGAELKEEETLDRVSVALLSLVAVIALALLIWKIVEKCRPAPKGSKSPTARSNLRPL